MKNAKKMLNSKNLFFIKKGFTIIELLVVIIIIGLLSTISFIALIGYTKDSRNSKRITDLQFLSNTLEIEILNGKNILSFASNSKNSIEKPSIAGITISNLSNKYIAGDINYSNLQLESSNFKDPDGKNYVLGVTSLQNGKYQLSASMELYGYKIAKVIGNYNQRLEKKYISGKIYGNMFKIDNPFDSSYFKKYDTIKNNYNSNLLEITNISNNGMVLTLSGNIDENITGFSIAQNEEPGLIKGTNSNGLEGIVVNDGVFLAY